MSDVVYSPEYVNHRNKLYETPLHKAVSRGDVEDVKKLLAMGADPDAQDVADNTPLMLAIFRICLYGVAESDYLEIIKILAKETTVKCYYDGMGIQHMLANNRHYKALIKILESGNYDVNEQTYDGATLLHIVLNNLSNSSQSSDKEEDRTIVEYLLKNGADTTIEDDDGYTAEDWAPDSLI